MIAPWPCSPTFPAHHVEAMHDLGSRPADFRAMWTNAPALSGRQAPPTGAPGPLRRAPSLRSRSRAGVFPDGALPTSLTGCLPHYSLPPALVDSPGVGADGCLRLRRAGKCECRAGASYLFSGCLSLRRYPLGEDQQV